MIWLRIRACMPAASSRAGQNEIRSKNSGVISIIAGTIGVIFWQILSGGNFYLGLLPVVFGCACGVLAFFIVNWIEWSRGVAPAPSAYLSEEEAAIEEARA